jgi:hypothetical protein
LSVLRALKARAIANYGGKTDHASEADQHDVEIIALETPPTDAEKRPPSI